MARVTKVLTNANDVCGPIDIPDEDSNYASVSIDASADGAVVLEISHQQDATGVDQWQGVEITTPLPAGSAGAASLVGSGAFQYGYALVPGAHKVRARKSVAGSGAMIVTLAVSCQ